MFRRLRNSVRNIYSRGKNAITNRFFRFVPARRPEQIQYNDFENNQLEQNLLETATSTSNPIQFMNNTIPEPPGQGQIDLQPPLSEFELLQIPTRRLKDYELLIPKSPHTMYPLLKYFKPDGSYVDKQYILHYLEGLTYINVLNKIKEFFLYHGQPTYELTSSETRIDCVLTALVTLGNVELMETISPLYSGYNMQATLARDVPYIGRLKDVYYIFFKHPHNRKEKIYDDIRQYTIKTIMITKVHLLHLLYILFFMGV